MLLKLVAQRAALRQFCRAVNMARFDGKVVIVTGSSSGIGAGTAVLFAREGAKVTITGRKQDGLEATKRCIIDAGGKEDNLNVVIADVTDASGREKVVSSTVQKWGQIDILVNNAGGMLRDDKGCGGVTASVDVLEKTMDLNVYSVVQMVQLARPYLAKTKGEVVNVSSIAGQPKGSPKFMYYAMAKAALDQMTRSLALELIPEGVRVNSVSPGAVVTRFCQSSGLSDAEAAKFYERFASSPDSLPIREIGQPEDIANIIAFLADRRVSRYIIGQTIVADGGSMLVIASNASVFKEEK
ncbi:hypothetical protein Y032_0596g444 [Ancylostoma ceylanicum]|uniref:Oxidoreductase, short chain dehydrogenase/reductase family protein n=1 Tax=Ancylostoma ceylanicum TaxID=53326 RepID=A0A016WP39_9BILA|nr:hypothetical protein Y032_0596g444 [Ancylostoma ceylanicum]